MPQDSTLIAVAVVIFLVVSLLLWKLTQWMTRTKWQHLLVFFIVSVGCFTLLGFGGLSIVNSQGQVETRSAQEQEEENALVLAETLPVETGTLSITLNSTGTLLPNEQQLLNFEDSAPIVEIMVETGDVVEEGTILARLDATDAEAQVHTAELDLAEAQAAYDALVAPPREIDIAIAEANIAVAQASLNAAAQGPSDISIEIARLEAELARNQLWQTQINRDVRLAPNPEFRGSNAYANEVLTQSGVERAELSVEIADTSYQETLNEGPDASGLASANAQLQSAQANLEQLLEGPSEADLRRAEIDIETAQLGLASAQRALEQTMLIAPFEGIVVVENLTIGTIPPDNEDDPTASAITLIDASRYTVDLSINETDVTSIEVGQTVRLDVQALGENSTITGTVTQIDIAPTADGQLVTYNVEVTIEGTENIALRPGMSAVATIILQEINDIIVIPNRFINTDPSTQQSTVTVEIDPGEYAEVPVTIGLRNADSSEIVDGLNVGDAIALFIDPNQQQGGQQGGGFFFGGRPPGGGRPGGGG